MFTLKNNSIGKVGVLYEGSPESSSSTPAPLVETVKNYKEFISKSPENQIKEIKEMLA